MMQFEFGIPAHVTFGNGSSKKAGDILMNENINKVLCVYDKGVKDAGIVDEIIQSLEASEIEVVTYDKVLPNPPDTVVEEGAQFARDEKVEAIVAIGGGSSIDAAKAINILITNESPITKYDGINNVENPTKPLIAIPTTAGTGSEVTGVTVVTDSKAKRKMVIGGKHCSADFALVDPELTVGLPPAITASTGLDALTHGIESFTSKFKQIPADVNALKAIELIYHNIELAYNDGNDIEARTNMILASMLAAFSFDNAFLGLVHAIAHPLSAHWGAPHGVANAACLPYVMEYNAQDEKVQKSYKEIAQVMGLDVANKSDAEASQMAIDEIKRLTEKFDIPSLKDLGVKEDELEFLAEETLKEEVSMMATPVDATKENIVEILKKAY